MKCFLCGGSFSKGDIECTFSVGEETIRVENIPFFRCDNCGEMFLSFKDVDLLFKIACNPSEFQDVEGK